MPLFPKPGLVIAGRYRLLEIVGVGGMGEVWAAEDLVAAGRVALKLLRADSGDDERARRGLLREARAARALSHDNIVRIRDVLDVDGQPVLVMDLLVGETLASRLERTPRLAVGEAIEVALPILAAIGAAHARGLVHRDLKPHNVFLVARKDAPPLVQVLDFGVARRAPGAAPIGGTDLSSTDAIAGTIEYMAPEQLLGARDVDARADLWSIGVILYQCLAGQLPTLGDNRGQVIDAVLHRTFEPLRRLRTDVPEPLSRLVERLLSREVASRPHDAREVYEGLAALVPAASFAPPPRPRRYRRIVPFIAAPIVLGAVVTASMRLRASSTTAMPARARVIACVPFRTLSPMREDAWLGVAAASIACERARVILGGGAGTTLIPAELLDLPHRSLAVEQAGVLETEAARARAIEAATRRGALILDGEVRRDADGFHVSVSLGSTAGAEPEARGDDRALHAAVRAAISTLERSGEVKRAARLDADYAEWSRAGDVGGALALFDLAQSFAENTGDLGAACEAVADNPAIAPAMRETLGWYCAYTRGLPAPAPRFEPRSPSEFALLARVRQAAERVRDRATIAHLRELLDAEKSALGQSTLATTISCLVQQDDSALAGQLALRAVRADPRNLLGETCAPWIQLVAATYDTPDSAGAARAMQAWTPWDSGAYYLDRGDSPAAALASARRAYLLSPRDTLAARTLGERLLGAGLREEAAAVAADLGAGRDPVHGLAGELLLVSIDASEARFQSAFDRARRALFAATDNDAGWLRVERLEAASLAVELGELLGRAGEVSEDAAKRLFLREPPLLDGADQSVPRRLVAICARVARPASRDACFARVRALRPRLSGAIQRGTDDFAAGAERWASGDKKGAARAFRSLMLEPGSYVELLPVAMAESFDAAGDDELVGRVANLVDATAARHHGATALDVFLMSRAVRRGDRVEQRARAMRIVDAWSVAGGDVVGLEEARRIVAGR